MRNSQILLVLTAFICYYEREVEMFVFLTIKYGTVVNCCSSALNRQIYLHGNTVGQCPNMGRCLPVVDKLWRALS